MFTTLLESRRRRERRLGHGALSLMLHLGLGVGAVEATRRVAAPAPDDPRMDTAVYLLEQPRPRPAPVEVPPDAPGLVPAPGLSVPVSVPIEIPSGLPPVEAGPAIDPSRFVPGPGRAPTACLGCPAALPGAAAVFTEATVEQPVEILEQASPRYPPMLAAARVAGRASVRFVVDTLGRVEPGSVTVVEADHPAFAASAVAAIERARFRPARIGSRAVRQLVLQTVRFRVE